MRFRLLPLAPCVAVLIASGCGTVEDPAAQGQKTVAIRQTDQLMRKQDAFLQRARGLLLEIEPLRNSSSWPGVMQSIHAARATSSPSAFALLTRQWELSGDDTYMRARRLLEQSASLEQERQALLSEWTAAMAEARASVSKAQYNAKQLQAVVGNTELFYEMNKTALNRFRVDESGFLTMANIHFRDDPVKPTSAGRRY